MTNLDSGTGESSNGSGAGGEVRIGDAERQAVVDMLSRHTAAGRLTLDEFAERAGHVFAAQTQADLRRQLADLPQDLAADPTAGSAAAGHSDVDRGAPPWAGPAAVATGWSPGGAVGEEDGRASRKRRFIAIMSGASARGRWWAPRKIRAFAWWGGVKIDLREAVISSPVVRIRASAYMGHVLIIVPEGIPVDMYGFVLMGGSTNRASGSTLIQGAPLVRVKARGLWGGVTVISGKQAAERSRQRAERIQAERERHRGYKLQQQGQEYVPGDRPHDAADYQASEAGVDPRSQPRGKSRKWHCGAKGELPLPSKHDALPLLDDLPGVAQAKDLVRNNLLAAAELFETGATSGPSRGEPRGARSSSTGPSARDAVQDEDADQPPATGGSRLPVGTMTILVTDIVGSTVLAGSLGDQRWMHVLRHHNEIVREQVTNNGGTEVKAQGDGFMMVFPSARNAVLASVDIQRAMAKYRAEHPEHQVELRVGLHTGEVVTDDNDIHGQHVVAAVRIADAAIPSEILVSGMTRDLTASASDLQFGGGRDIVLKGFDERQRVHQVHWQ